jgi:Flp pilus assembly protein TadD
MIDPADPLASAHDLSALGEYDLALRAFSQAALDQGLTPEILAGMGAANLGLGRLGQAEPLLRRAAEAEPAWPENLNNLGVVLLEQGKAGEAVQTLRRAYALDNGESDAIRNNLRLALATLENSDTVAADSGGYRLVRLGGGSFLLSTPQ